MNNLIFIYQKDCGTHQAVEAIIDGCPQVSDWYKAFPSTFYLQTTSGVKGLATYLEKKIPGGTFLIIRPASMDGILPEEEWSFLGMGMRE